MNTNLEVRDTRSNKLEVRKTRNGHVVAGRIQYRSPSHPLPFIEYIMPGCFKDSLRTQEVQALYAHNDENILARQSNNTLRIRDTSDALLWEADLPNTTLGNDLAVLLADETIRANSFGFIVPDEAGADEWLMDGDKIVRKVHKALLFEVSLVGSPAYEANVSQLVRSAPRWVGERLNVTTQDDLDDSENSQEECSCRCVPCIEDRCAQCEATDCDDDACEDCPAQDTDNERTLLLLNIARRRNG